MIIWKKMEKVNQNEILFYSVGAYEVKENVIRKIKRYT